MALRGMLLKSHKAYRGNYLWVPKSRVNNIQGIKESLKFPRPGSVPLYGYRETQSHLVLPREYIPIGEYPDLDFEVVDLVTSNFPRTRFRATAQPRDEIQSLAMSHLIEDGSGMLCLACGKGKTVVSLMAAAKIGLHVVVIVDTVDLALQWRDRILEFTDIPEGDIGWIQGKKWDWEGKPITIAMIKTLANRVDELPPKLVHQTGLVIFDEAHILGAPEMNKTVGIFRGLRWGLTATKERSDGLEELYLSHIGPVLYENLETDLVPKIFFVRTGILMPKVPRIRSQLNDATGELSVSKIHTWLSTHPKRNAIIQQLLDGALGIGRTSLVLGDRTAQLQALSGNYPDSGLITGRVKGEERVSALQTRNPVFASTKIAKKGLDRKELDTLFILQVFKSVGPFRQMLGRIQRLADDKHHPIAIILEDEFFPPLANLCRRLRGHLNALNYPFERVKPEDFLS